MIEIKHARATLKVRPEHAQETHDFLAVIDKSKGKRGRKFGPQKAGPRSASKRTYPVFYPGMSTTEYLVRFHQHNGHLMWKGLAYTYADRVAPSLDPSYPEVLETQND